MIALQHGGDTQANRAQRLVVACKKNQRIRENTPFQALKTRAQFRVRGDAGSVGY